MGFHGMGGGMSAYLEEQQKRGRPRKLVTVEPTQPKRSRGRPPKYVLAEVVAVARTAGSFTN